METNKQNERYLFIASPTVNECEADVKKWLIRFDSIRGSLIGPPKYSDLLLSGVVARSSVSEATYKKSVCSERVWEFFGTLGNQCKVFALLRERDESASRKEGFGVSPLTKLGNPTKISAHSYTTSRVKRGNFHTCSFFSILGVSFALGKR